MGHGTVYRGSLLEKLLVLAATKFATIDPYGMGIEMEGGKPGWYDALNGLPGIFGSSMSESYELQRMLAYLDHALGLEQEIPIFVELEEFLQTLHRVVDAQLPEIIAALNM